MADEAQLRSLLGNAELALGQGRPADALKLIGQARIEGAQNAEALAACGVLTLQAGNPGDARALIEQAIALNPRDPRSYVNLAAVMRAFNDSAGELKACDQALALDPYFFTANLQKGSLFERLGDRKRAASAYHACLASLRPGMQLAGAFRPLLEHAQEVVRSQFRELDEWLQSRLEPLRRQFAGDSLERVDDCLAIFLGKKRVFNSQPTMTYFPRLPAIPFFDRRDFPWIEAVEAQTEAMREELSALLAGAPQNFTPYVNHAPGSPLGQWGELNNSKRWSALFLFKDGVTIEENLARCPRTVAALALAPQVKIPNRGPTAFFSRLEPGTRIPPHTGSTNTRLTVHIPLIVPPKCGFRVGAEVREWQPGTALIFDDTIEHEAWNESDEPRVILIFDIWNPLLTTAERELMTVATAGIAEFFSES
jgi:aspartyl/asparaginyl beta-hydroxylase (cupin superfamily)